MNSNQTFLARQAAIDLIKSYVLRGDSLESLMKSYLGCCCNKYSAQIGGYVNSKGYPCSKIVVSKLDGVEILPQAFSLLELYAIIKSGKSLNTIPVQYSLFDI